MEEDSGKPFITSLQGKKLIEDIKAFSFSGMKDIKSISFIAFESIRLRFDDCSN